MPYHGLLSYDFVMRFTLCLGLLVAVAAFGADQPQWGQAWSRNMVSDEKGLPESFDPVTGLNIAWSVPLGTETYSTPIVAHGRVYIGTNNNNPRDPKHQGDRGVLLCLDEATGQLLWQLVVPKREEDPYMDWPNTGSSSAVTVEGDRVYFVDNRGEVLCLDAKGLANGNDGPFQDEGRHMTPTNLPALTPGKTDADIIWALDLTAAAGIWSHDAACSSILIHGDHLYLNTSTGVDNTHRKIRTPDAPSIVVVDKKTGRLLARDEEKIAPNIFHCTWASPAFVEIGGKPVILFNGGDGVIYGFEPIKIAPPKGAVATLKKIFQFQFDKDVPVGEVHWFTSNRREGPSNIYGMPVYAEGGLFVAGGGDVFWGKKAAWLKRIDLPGLKPVERWSVELSAHVLSTAAVKDGIVYIADCGHIVRAVDAVTGKELWSYDASGDFWSSPMVADGKILIASRRGKFISLAAGREKKLLAEVDLGVPVSATVTAANGAYYVATQSKLFAVRKGAVVKTLGH